MIKKTYLLMAALLIGQLGYASSAQAICAVTDPKDDKSISNTLRYILEEFIDAQNNPPCNGNSADTFEKIVFDNTHNIVLNSTFDIEVKKDLSITTETEVTGYPVINAFNLAEGANPFNFTYTSGAQVTYQNMVILTNKVEASKILDGVNGINGGNVHVCSDQDAYEKGLNNGKSPGESGWCTTSMVSEQTIPQKLYYKDTDLDTYGDSSEVIILPELSDAPKGYVENSDDCNDSDAAINPAAKEICDNGIDDNCDGKADNCLYRDVDGDGYGSNKPTDASNPSDVSVSLEPGQFTRTPGDCNDRNAEVNPVALEVCDGVDNNCDGTIDEGCTTWYNDSDKDGFGNATDSISAQLQPTGYVADSTDCNDTDATINPAAAEICGNAVDENCDGVVAGECGLFYPDVDKDGFGDETSTGVADASTITNPVTNNDDCNDGNAEVKPTAIEICDGIDNNCDGVTDAGCLTWYLDSDSDGFGDPAVTTISTTPPANYVADSTDCNDGNGTINPAATEVCDNLMDDDCDGAVDEDCTTDLFYPDVDGDGFGDETSTGVTDGSTITNPVSNNGDCNDGNVAINPSATEVCENSIDDDCDGSVDEDCPTDLFYPDVDGDGFGDETSTGVTDGSTITNPVSNNGDCNDGNVAVNPSATEVCENSIDDDCDGSVDEDCPTDLFYPDVDGDGFGDETSTGVTDGSTITNPVSNNGDCNDGNVAVNPSATEVCENAIDDDCDGSVDEDCSTPSTWYPDVDGDGYGNATGSISATEQPDGYVADNTDCNDTVATINPMGIEVCDGLDNDCDGSADEGLSCGSISTWYRDADGDGFGNPALSTEAAEQPAGYVSNNGDCDDTNPLRNISCTSNTYFPDVDLDGFGDPTAPVLGSEAPTGYVSNGSDCNDTNQSINPSATEVCDGVDNNCNGDTDEGLDCTNGDTEVICNDLADNDGDELVDCADPDCANAQKCMASEGTGDGSAESCVDGFDNDGDSLVDCSDPGCVEECSNLIPEGSGSVPETECGDGVDNDHDGLSDCNDAGCAQTEVCGFEPNPSDSDGSGLGDLFGAKAFSGCQLNTSGQATGLEMKGLMVVFGAILSNLLLMRIRLSRVSKE